MVRCEESCEDGRECEGLRCPSGEEMWGELWRLLRRRWERLRS